MKRKAQALFRIQRPHYGATRHDRGARKIRRETRDIIVNRDIYYAGDLVYRDGDYVGELVVESARIPAWRGNVLGLYWTVTEYEVDIDSDIAGHHYNDSWSHDPDNRTWAIRQARKAIKLALTIPGALHEAFEAGLVDPADVAHFTRHPNLPRRSQ